MTSINVQTITSTEEFFRLEGVWNSTLSRSDANSIFLTWEWISSWWKTYGPAKELRVVVARESSGEIVGIAPLYLRRSRVAKGIPLREIRLLGTGEDVSPDYPDFLVKKGGEEEVVRAILAALDCDDWDVLNLTDMPGESKVARALLDCAPERDLAARTQPCSTCPYVLLPGSWEEFLAGLSSNTRYNVKRRIKNLERDFSVRFYFWKDGETVPEAIRKLSSLHRKRWAALGTGRSFASPEYLAFHESVAREFARKGWLHLSCLEVNGEIVGMYYDYLYNNRIFYYQAGFDPDLGKYSPGLVLRAYVIRHAIESGVSELDLLKGDYDFKKIWTDRSRSTDEVTIGRKNIAGRMFLFEKYRKPRMKAMVRNHLPSPVLRIFK